MRLFIPQSPVTANTAPQSAARREGTYISVLVVCAEAVFNTYGLMGVILLVPCSHRLSEIQAFFVVVVAFVPSRIQQTLKPPKDFKKEEFHTAEPPGLLTADGTIRQLRQWSY